MVPRTPTQLPGGSWESQPLHSHTRVEVCGFRLSPPSLARISPPASGAVSRSQGFGGSKKAPRAGVTHHVSQELLSSNTSSQRSTTPVLPKEVPSRKCVVSPEVTGSMARRPSRSQHPQHLTGWFSWTPGPTGFPFPISQRIDLFPKDKPSSSEAKRAKGNKGRGKLLPAEQHRRPNPAPPAHPKLHLPPLENKSWNPVGSMFSPQIQHKDVNSHLPSESQS